MPQSTKEPGWFDAPEELHSAVEALDPEAAAYLRSHNTRRATTLLMVFSWMNSPQGYAYWSNLHQRLREPKPQRYYADGLPY